MSEEVSPKKSPITKKVREVRMAFLRLPQNIWEFAGLVVILLGIWIIAPSIIRSLPRGGKLEVGIQTLKLAYNGADSEPPDSDSMLFGFWTPSDETRTDVCDKGLTGQDCAQNCATELNDDEKEDRKKDTWECSATDSEVEAFQNGITTRYLDQKWWQGASLIGLRRWKVQGVGQTDHEKHGWWWVMNVKSNFPRQDFADQYLKFWCHTGKTIDTYCMTKKVYIEVITGSTGHYSVAGPLGSQ